MWCFGSKLKSKVAFGKSFLLEEGLLVHQTKAEVNNCAYKIKRWLLLFASRRIT